MSETGSSTLNSPTTAPLVKLTERLPNPPTYFSKRNELWFFFNQLKNKRNGNVDYYATLNSQLYYTISRLTGNAAETVYLFQLSTVKELIIILEVSYSDLNRIAIIQKNQIGWHKAPRAFRYILLSFTVMLKGLNRINLP